MASIIDVNTNNNNNNNETTTTSNAEALKIMNTKNPVANLDFGVKFNISKEYLKRKLLGKGDDKGHGGGRSHSDASPRNPLTDQHKRNLSQPPNVYGHATKHDASTSPKTTQLKNTESQTTPLPQPKVHTPPDKKDQQQQTSPEKNEEKPTDRSESETDEEAASTTSNQQRGQYENQLNQEMNNAMRSLNQPFTFGQGIQQGMGTVGPIGEHASQSQKPILPIWPDESIDKSIDPPPHSTKPEEPKEKKKGSQRKQSERSRSVQEADPKKGRQEKQKDREPKTHAEVSKPEDKDSEVDPIILNFRYSNRDYNIDRVVNMNKQTGQHRFNFGDNKNVLIKYRTKVPRDPVMNAQPRVLVTAVRFRNGHQQQVIGSCEINLDANDLMKEAKIDGLNGRFQLLVSTDNNTTLDNMIIH